MVDLTVGRVFDLVYLFFQQICSPTISNREMIAMYATTHTMPCLLCTADTMMHSIQDLFQKIRITIESEVQYFDLRTAERESEMDFATCKSVMDIYFLYKLSMHYSTLGNT